jgi:hypothetical protein
MHPQAPSLRFLQYRNYLMDALLFVAILSVQPYLKRFLLAEVVTSQNNITNYTAAVGWLYIATALSQGFGALFVHQQVAYQLQLPGRPSYMLFPLIALLIMHFIIFGVLFWIDGIKYIQQGYIPVWAYLFMFFPTLMAMLIIIPPTKQVLPPQSPIIVITTFIGTLLLTFSALVVLTLFWNLLIEDLGKDFFTNFSNSEQSTFKIITSKILITLLFAALFLLFYAPSRLVFLSTDWHKRNTWIGMAILFSPFTINLWAGN